jgi:hypothetical protein
VVDGAEGFEYLRVLARGAAVGRGRVELHAEAQGGGVGCGAGCEGLARCAACACRAKRSGEQEGGDAAAGRRLGHRLSGSGGGTLRWMRSVSFRVSLLGNHLRGRSGGRWSISRVTEGDTCGCRFDATRRGWRERHKVWKGPVRGVWEFEPGICMLERLQARKLVCADAVAVAVRTGEPETRMAHLMLHACFNS